MFKVIWFDSCFGTYVTEDWSSVSEKVDSLMSLDHVVKIVVYEDGIILRNISRSEKGWLYL